MRLIPSGQKHGTMENSSGLGVGGSATKRQAPAAQPALGGLTSPDLSMCVHKAGRQPQGGPCAQDPQDTPGPHTGHPGSDERCSPSPAARDCVPLDVSVVGNCPSPCACPSSPHQTTCVHRSDCLCICLSSQVSRLHLQWGLTSPARGQLAPIPQPQTAEHLHLPDVKRLRGVRSHRAGVGPEVSRGSQESSEQRLSHKGVGGRGAAGSGGCQPPQPLALSWLACPRCLTVT